MEEFFEKGTHLPRRPGEGPSRSRARGSALPRVPDLGGPQRGRPSPARRPRRSPALAGRPGRGGRHRSRAQGRCHPGAFRPGAGLGVRPSRRGDPHAGRISLFRVYSGTLRADTTVQNTTRDTAERAGRARAAPGQDPDPGARGPGRGPRCGGQAQGDEDGDTLRTRPIPSSIPDRLPRARHHLRHRAQDRGTRTRSPWPSTA
jgi:hypothetical protein